MNENLIEIVSANIADIRKAVIEQARIETYMRTYMDESQLEMSGHVRSSLIYALDTLSSLLKDNEKA